MFLRYQSSNSVYNSNNYINFIHDSLTLSLYHADNYYTYIVIQMLKYTANLNILHYIAN